jgi:hypothetical protein
VLLLLLVIAVTPSWLGAHGIIVGLEVIVAATD